MLSTRKIIDFLLPSVVAGVTTYQNYSSKEAARQIEDQDLKDRIKNDSSNKVSTMGVIIDAATGCEFLITFFGNRAWQQINKKQGFLVALSVAGGIACTIYSVAVFGHEKNTLAAGISATTAALFFKCATAITNTNFAERPSYQPV